MHEVDLLYDRIHDLYRSMCTCGWTTDYSKDMDRAWSAGTDHQETNE